MTRRNYVEYASILIATMLMLPLIQSAYAVEVQSTSTFTNSSSPILLQDYRDPLWQNSSTDWSLRLKPANGTRKILGIAMYFRDHYPDNDHLDLSYYENLFFSFSQNSLGSIL